MRMLLISLTLEVPTNIYCRRYTTLNTFAILPLARYEIYNDTALVRTLDDECPSVLAYSDGVDCVVS